MQKQRFFLATLFVAQVLLIPGFAFAKDNSRFAGSFQGDVGYGKCAESSEQITVGHDSSKIGKGYIYIPADGKHDIINREGANPFTYVVMRHKSRVAGAFIEKDGGYALHFTLNYSKKKDYKKFSFKGIRTGAKLEKCKGKFSGKLKKGS